ncbi:hypothetical protein [Mucilaginibacter sp.]|uniref:hypothetical protein n=1 Tax=Mucilaginibacter sp. TaxID=1882438 RepID=UPI003D126917
MKRYFLWLLLMAALNSFAQKTGSFSYTVNVTSTAGGTITSNQPQPYTKYTNYDAYWFVKPNGDRFLFINGGKNLGIVILHSRGNDTTLAYEENYRGDQFLLQGSYNGKIVRVQPDKEGVKIHYDVFTAGEIELHFSGPVMFAVGTNTSDHLTGSINGTLHLYREPFYEKTSVAPNCNCDPTIYAFFYDQEIGRTPSACENAVLWRVYNALQPALSPLLSLNYTGGSPAPVGSFIYRQDHSMIDVSEAPEANPCSPDLKRRDVVSTNAQTRMFSQDDYSLGFIHTVDLKQFGDPMENANMMRALVPYQDSLMKLVIARKITMDDATKKINARMTALQGGKPQADIKQAEVYNHLDVLAKVNVIGGDIYLDKTAEIQHNVPGAAFEIYKRSIRYDDGTWTPFVKYIFFGKFNIVRNGNTITAVTPVYGAGGNKLTIYNAVITVKGGKELVDQAMNTINFSAVPAMLNNN